MSFKAEVIADSSGKWCGNQLVFATEEEAQQYAEALQKRWVAVQQIRTVFTSESPNSEIKNGSLIGV
jgi:hypothetical protein